jgi:hypothetical protein
VIPPQLWIVKATGNTHQLLHALLLLLRTSPTSLFEKITQKHPPHFYLLPSPPINPPVNPRSAADTTTKNARKAVPTEITKRAPVEKEVLINTKRAHAAHHRFFMEPEQLSTIIEQHNDDGNQQMCVGGTFYAVGPGEEVGSVEIDIKVSAGFKFLVFPGVVKLVKLVEGEEMEDEGEIEMEHGEREIEQAENEARVFGLGAVRIRAWRDGILPPFSVLGFSFFLVVQWVYADAE